MTFLIKHCTDGEPDDSVQVSGATVDECRTKAFEEMRKRGWKEPDCYSEEVV